MQEYALSPAVWKDFGHNCAKVGHPFKEGENGRKQGLCPAVAPKRSKFRLFIKKPLFLACNPSKLWL